MDFSPFLTRSPLNHGLAQSKPIMVDYGVRPASKEGPAGYERIFTEETCILIALLNGFDKVVILNYPHKSHFKNGIHEPHPNHITAAFGHHGDRIEKAHVYVSEIRPYIICRREDTKIDIVWGGHLGYTFEPVLSFVVQAWLNLDSLSQNKLEWQVIKTNEVRRKLKTTGILNLNTWRRGSSPPAPLLATPTTPSPVHSPNQSPTAEDFANGMGKGLREFGRTTITPTIPHPPTLHCPGSYGKRMISGLHRRSKTLPNGDKIRGKENSKDWRVKSGEKSTNDGHLDKENGEDVDKENKNLTNPFMPKPKLKLAPLTPFSRDNRNWRETMSPLPDLKDSIVEPREDPWRQLQRICENAKASHFHVMPLQLAMGSRAAALNHAARYSEVLLDSSR